MKTTEEILKCGRLIDVASNKREGFACLYRGGKIYGTVIWSVGGGWDHVSVNPRESKTPTWEIMCEIKNIFFHEDETVVEYHPAKRDYVNNLEHCLHLWRPQEEKLPVPPPIMVGIRDGATPESIAREIHDLFSGGEKK